MTRNRYLRGLLALGIAAAGVVVVACSHNAAPTPPGATTPLEPVSSDAGVVPTPPSSGTPSPDVPHASLHGRAATNVAEREEPAMPMAPLDAGITRDALLPIPDVGRPPGPVDASGPTPQPAN